MKGFISLELLNRLERVVNSEAPGEIPASHKTYLLRDIYEEVKPGEALSPVSELGILHFAEGQWGVKPLEGVLLKACAELGEAADAVIKHGEGRDTLEHADMEVGDVLVVLSQYAAKRGTTLDGLRAAAFQKCKDRVVRMALIEEDNAMAKFVQPVSMFDQMMSRLNRVPQMGENLNGEEDDHPLWCINAQIVDLMGGGAASEDHRDILSFLRSTGLSESTVKRMHLALCNAEELPRPVEQGPDYARVEAKAGSWDDLYQGPVQPDPTPRGYEGQDLDDLFADEPDN